MHEHFYALVDDAAGRLTGSEVVLANFAGEQSDFVRFNRSRVRQPMSVRQAYLTLTLIDGQRRNSMCVALSGDPTADRAQVANAIGLLRGELGGLPEDPYLLYSTSPTTSERIELGQLPPGEAAVDAVLRAASGHDLVGIYACGPMQRGFASSLGHRHWHEVASLHLDWSLVASGDKAVKASFAAAQWDSAALERSIEQAAAQLPHLAQPVRTIAPGEYRAYLAPAALDELLWMLNWSGVSAKAQRTKSSCLQKLVEGDAQLSSMVTLREHTAAGLAPAFDEVGFVKPPTVDLIVGGRHAGSMTSPRTAQEYGLEANGADEEEALRSMELAPGRLTAGEVFSALDTGVYISNLWYLNFSDRPSARITGMTRFASLWVERGAVVGPLAVMRFDDTLYRMLGEHLIDLTAEREWILNSSTYGQRSVETSNVPGALIGGLRFTL